MVYMLLDSNIYGTLIVDDEPLDVIERIINSTVIVRNFALIRDELRNTAATKRLPTGRKARTSLLNAYDLITTDNVIPVNRGITQLADEFYRAYRRLGGHVGKKKILSDFKIVACATLHDCDIIVSNDNRTMRSPKALQAYGAVALFHGRRAPNFMSYSDLKRALTDRLG